MFFEASKKGLSRHGTRFCFSTMHVIKETVARSNWASGGGNIIKEGVANFLEGIWFVHSVVIFNILCFFHGLSPKGSIVGIMQNIVLLSGTQLFNGEVVEAVINNNVVIHVCILRVYSKPLVRCC